MKTNLFTLVAIVAFIMSCTTVSEKPQEPVETVCVYQPTKKEMRADMFVESIDLDLIQNQFKFCILSSYNRTAMSKEDLELCNWLVNDYPYTRSAIILVCKESAHLRQDVREKCGKFVTMEYEISVMTKTKGI